MTQKTRARSRLQSKEKLSEKKLSQTTPETFSQHKKNKLKTTQLLSHITHLPTFLLALLFYGITYFMVTTIHPIQIQNWLLVNTYLPFQIVLFLGNFFLFSFIFLKTRRGFLIATAIFLVIFLKLQGVIFSWLTLLIISSIVLIIEVLTTLLENKMG